jgi:hypothetical protein
MQLDPKRMDVRKLLMQGSKHPGAVARPPSQPPITEPLNGPTGPEAEKAGKGVQTSDTPDSGAKTFKWIKTPESKSGEQAPAGAAVGDEHIQPAVDSADGAQAHGEEPLPVEVEDGLPLSELEGIPVNSGDISTALDEIAGESQGPAEGPEDPGQPAEKTGEPAAVSPATTCSTVDRTVQFDFSAAAAGDVREDDLGLTHGRVPSHPAPRRVSTAVPFDVTKHSSVAIWDGYSIVFAPSSENRPRLDFQLVAPHSGKAHKPYELHADTGQSDELLFKRMPFTFSVYWSGKTTGTVNTFPRLDADKVKPYKTHGRVRDWFGRHWGSLTFFGVSAGIDAVLCSVPAFKQALDTSTLSQFWKSNLPLIVPGLQLVISELTFLTEVFDYRKKAKTGEKI